MTPTAPDVAPDSPVPARDDGLRHLPLRERKRERARRHVEQVALQLFAERGYDHVSVAEVAEVAEVAVRTFFRYFASKEDVLLDDARRRLARGPALLAEHAENRPDDAVGAVVDALVELSAVGEHDRVLLLQRHRVLCRTPSLLGAVLGVLSSAEQEIAAFVAARRGCSATEDLYPALVAAVIGAAHHTAMTQWVDRGACGDPRPLVMAALAQVTPGLREHVVPHVAGPAA